MGVLTDQLLAVATAYCEAEGIALSTASGRSFDESKLLVNLAARLSSPTLRRADRALQWFSDHWPDSAVWPESVPRPASSLPSVPERRASQPNTDHPRGSEGSCPEAGSPASGPFIPEAVP